ncbi:hypothetical protein [Streptomyces lydicus]|uniref:hypothetical protein n=1 Tax=Streptomyces lydicus TaxID=47763 RepID=UPI0010114475|nr:hypothetical protein [Streptomyces lydicus]MCZ1011966.1 hypothetical protein [Streptomyces lydicus]
MKFHDRAIRKLIEDTVPEHDPTLTTVTRLLEFMGTKNLFATHGVQDVWLSSDGSRGARLEINIPGWGVYQSALLPSGTAAFPGLNTRTDGERMDLRTAAERIYSIVARVVEGVARDAEQYVHEAIATYSVVVQRPDMTETLTGGPAPRSALLTALGALSLAAAELGLDYAPQEARDQLGEYGTYTLGQLSVTISLRVTLEPCPRLKRRPIVPAPDRILSRDLKDSSRRGRT